MTHPANFRPANRSLRLTDGCFGVLAPDHPDRCDLHDASMFEACLCQRQGTSSSVGALFIRGQRVLRVGDELLAEDGLDQCPETGLVEVALGLDAVFGAGRAIQP
jgi:hypothetical protein